MAINPRHPCRLAVSKQETDNIVRVIGIKFVPGASTRSSKASDVYSAQQHGPFLDVTFDL
ncbi:MAG: hypothetical protein LBG73_00580 [Spirochaetaceae bacterium]|nr:hypothetical protein [Spirochaetaceae bacterium]